MGLTEACNLYSPSDDTICDRPRGHDNGAHEAASLAARQPLPVDPDLRALSDAATPGKWNAHPDGLVWAERPGDPVSASTEPEDAAFIAAAANHLRARLAAPVDPEGPTYGRVGVRHEGKVLQADGTYKPESAPVAPGEDALEVRGLREAAQGLLDAQAALRSAVTDRAADAPDRIVAVDSAYAALRAALAASPEPDKGWEAAMQDPAFVASLNEGLADVAAGRVKPLDPGEDVQDA